MMIRSLVAVVATSIALLAGAAVAAERDHDDATPAQILLLLRLPPDHFRPDGNYAGSYGDSYGRQARRRIATQLAAEHGLQLLSDWPMPLLGVDCFVLAVPEPRNAAAVARELSLDTRVAWAQTTHRYLARGHGDPLYALQPAAEAWRLSELHQQSTGRDVRIAVIDSGIEATHPDLDGQVLLSRNFLLDGRADAVEDHGTGIAGIIGARADNGAGIAGIAPKSRLLALRACGQEASGTRCDTLSLAKALHYPIDKRAAVVNLQPRRPTDRLLGRLVDLALERGVDVVAAVDPALPGGGLPAAQRGSSRCALKEVWLCHFPDPRPDGRHEVASKGLVEAGSTVHAPGRDVPTTRPGARSHLVSGASHAAAHAPGTQLAMLFFLITKAQLHMLISTTQCQDDRDDRSPLSLQIDDPADHHRDPVGDMAYHRKIMRNEDIEDAAVLL